MTQEINLQFKINNQLITLCVPIDGSDTLFKLTNDDEFTCSYIIDLINNGTVSLDEPLQNIHRMEGFNSAEARLIYPVELLMESTEESDIMENFEEVKQQLCEWTDAETRMLLDKYEHFMSRVGPKKKFKTKKCMWLKIAEILNDYFGTRKTGVQVENRYKTVLKRKKTAVDNNHKSGSSRIEIPFESELNKISANDDSIEPEILGTAKGITIKKNRMDKVVPLNYERSESPSTSSSTPKKRKSKTIQETLWKIFERKEEARERRHKEKIDTMKELFKEKTD